MGNLSHYTGHHNTTPGIGGGATPGSPGGGDTLDHAGAGSGGADGYASEDIVAGSSSGRERKKGVPWTEEEHRMFLLGLQKLGKGDWRGISRNYVISRTPTQVASHAQKYFIRQSNLSRRKRRSSLFDIVAEEAEDTPMVSHDFFSVNPQDPETHNSQGNNSLPPPLEEECESMASTNSTADADSNSAPNPESSQISNPQPMVVSSQNCYPVMYPTFYPGYYPFSVQFFAPYETSSVPTTELAPIPNPAGETHEVLKPTAVHSNRPINVDELVGMSKLSLGESLGHGEPSSLSLKLLEGTTSRQSAFHPNPVGDPGPPNTNINSTTSHSPIHAL